MEEREARIKRITHIYYSNPEVQRFILEFSKNREVVPRYFESFGKRPDTLQYPADIMGFVKKGATSFHASEEIWEDPLRISSDWNIRELNDARKSWDLVIDIDSKYLDYSKIAAILMINTIEKFGVNNYWIKFSGSKGFHIIISGEAFPKEYRSMKTKEMFPEWPRAICEFLTQKIKPEYNKIITSLKIDFKALEERTKLTKDKISEVICPNCGRPSKKGILAEYKCPDCKTSIKRKDPKITKRQLVCINDNCAGKLDIIKKEDYFYCEYCKVSSIEKRINENKGAGAIVYSSSLKKDDAFSDRFVEEISGSSLADLDLVLVSPRHLFRMPYSLHEKTCLASVVVEKKEIEKFDPLKDANPLNVKVKNFLPNCIDGEASRLLTSALEWKEKSFSQGDMLQKKQYKDYDEKIDVNSVSEDMFPKPIKKLLKGLTEGKKRGLFVLITFLRSLNFSPEYMNEKVREWNKKNDPPLKEGYVKGQIDWHLKQKKRILPPNYNNNNFYKDLGLLEEKPMVKNPIVEVLRKVREKG